MDGWMMDGWMMDGWMDGWMDVSNACNGTCVGFGSTKLPVN